MRVYGPSGLRNIPTDRNPTTIATGARVTGQAGPGDLALAVYLVPAGRRFIGEASSAVTVTTAGAAGTTATARVAVFPNAGALNTAEGQDTEQAPAIGVKVVAQGVPIQLKAGDQVQAIIGISAATPVCTGIGGIHGVEYDA